MKIIKILIIGFLLLNLLYASETIPTEEEVTKLYVATFNRAPDAAGLNYWLNSSGLALSQIAQSFFDQEETKVSYPEGTSNSDFITSVYQNLFNREADTNGLNYWETELNINKISKNRFIEAVINGVLNTDTSNDADILTNKMIVGLSFANTNTEHLYYSKVIMANVTENNDSVDSALDIFDLVKYELTTDNVISVLKNGYIDANTSMKKKFQLVYNQENFNEVYKTFDSNATPEVDFTKNYVAVLELGYKISKDYSVKVTKIQEENRYRTIFVDTTVLDENCPGTGESILPFEIVSFPFESYKETLFQESVKVIKCDEVNTTDIASTINFRELNLGNYGAKAHNMDSTFHVVEDSSVYENLYYNHINPIGTDKELPYVDFSNEVLIALFLGRYGFYDLEVNSVKEYNNYIEIGITREIIDNYCAIPAVVTSPATFIVVPKTEKEIIFKENAQVRVCEYPLSGFETLYPDL